MPRADRNEIKAKLKSGNVMTAAAEKQTEENKVKDSKNERLSRLVALKKTKSSILKRRIETEQSASQLTCHDNHCNTKLPHSQHQVSDRGYDHSVTSGETDSGGKPERDEEVGSVDSEEAESPELLMLQMTLASQLDVEEYLTVATPSDDSCDSDGDHDNNYDGSNCDSQERVDDEVTGDDTNQDIESPPAVDSRSVPTHRKLKMGQLKSCSIS